MIVYGFVTQPYLTQGCPSHTARKALSELDKGSDSEYGSQPLPVSPGYRGGPDANKSNTETQADKHKHFPLDCTTAAEV